MRVTAKDTKGHIDKTMHVCYNPYARVTYRSPSRSRMTINDPLMLEDSEISRYKKGIVKKLISLGKSSGEAVKSAERWQESLTQIRREFGFLTAE